MKDPFKKVVLAATGDFGKDRSDQKIKQWVERQGGKYTSKIGPEVTHLVASKDHYKRSAKMVEQALKIRSLKIVTFDWLEDSLLKSTRKKEGPYLLNQFFKEKEKAKAKKKVARKEKITHGLLKFEKDCDNFRTTMHTDGYHIYRDPTGFAYDITLARSDLTTNQNERYNLKILAPLASSFDLAISLFTDFFKLKTHMEWKDRNSKLKVKSERVFTYTPPTPTSPQGCFPEDEEVIW